MTLEEVRQHYPGAAELIYACETDPGLHNVTERALAAEATPEETLTLHSEGIAHAMKEYPCVKTPPFLEQAYHPDFLKYLRAKFGCM